VSIIFNSRNMFTSLFRKSKFKRNQYKLINSLTELSQELRMFNAGTEEDFLTIGDYLQDFSRRAREISETSAGVASLMTGVEINNVIEILNQVLNRIGDLGGECERLTAALQQIINTLNDIAQSMSGFMKIVKTLLMLGVFTRVESAHVGIIGSDFSALANQVNELAKDIEAKSNKILSQSSSLVALIQQSLTNALSIKALQQDQLQRIIENSTDSLKSLHDKHNRSSSLSTNVALKYKHISNNIDQIITLLQVHDITRQQIDHVEKAISSLTSALQENSLGLVKKVASDNVGN
jgi:ABC-type transporter Mla subunit MlaD